MGSNQGNPFNELLYLVQGFHGVLHSEVNGTGVGVGYGNRTASGAGWHRRDVTGKAGGGRGKNTGERT